MTRIGRRPPPHDGYRQSWNFIPAERPVHPALRRRDARAPRRLPGTRCPTSERASIQRRRRRVSRSRSPSSGRVGVEQPDGHDAAGDAQGRQASAGAAVVRRLHQPQSDPAVGDAFGAPGRRRRPRCGPCASRAAHALAAVQRASTWSSSKVLCEVVRN
ncbi:MAG: hypothetical protein MZW92_14135 [Comamonadaceae bacterium]|nr:hypothetical protein [Comamonadaceae bacterium]